MCGSTCFGHLSAHNQERTIALGASGFTVGAWRLERCWSWSGRLCGTEWVNYLLLGKMIILLNVKKQLF